MTDDEHSIEIVKAVQNFSENKKKIANLVSRLDGFSRLKSEFANATRVALANGIPIKLNVVNSEGLEAMRDFESDPREVAANLLELLKEQEQLRAILRTHDFEVE